MYVRMDLRCASEQPGQRCAAAIKAAVLKAGSVLTVGPVYNLQFGQILGIPVGEVLANQGVQFQLKLVVVLGIGSGTL